jgi:hypothetical protein
MKLFQQMLVAGASLSLLAPVASQASDVVNVEEMNSYARSQSNSSRLDSQTFINEVSEDIAILKGRVDGLEVKQREFEAGGFSDTTVMDQKVVFDLGVMDFSETDADNETTQFAYSYRMNLNTSFTGDDNMYIRILSGNHGQWMKDSNDGGYLTSVGKGNDLQVDKIWYSFPLGENNTVWVGPKIENYYMHGTAPSIYKPVTKQFTLGGNGNAYGASTDTGAGWAYKADNGFAISSNIGTKSKTTNGETGLLTDNSKTSWATQVGYTQPQYAISAIVNAKFNGWTDGYLHTASADDALVSGGNHTAVGLRGWWRPESTGTAMPSISVGYDTTQYDGVTSGTDSSDMWFVGLQWQDMINADDKIGLALAQPTMHDDETNSPFAYELYYSYKANDNVTVTPTIFGGTDRDGGTEDVFGALVQTTFKF